MSTYGTIDGVKAYVAHVGANRTNAPTDANYEQWLIQRSAQLTSWLAAAGYTVPVVQTEAKAVLDRFANVGAACDAEMTQRSSGFDENDQNRRENKFCSEFGSAAAWIAGDGLNGLGVPQIIVGALSHQPQIGIITIGGENDLTRLLPREWRS